MQIDVLHIIFIIVALTAIILLCYVKDTAVTGWEELKSGKKHTNDFVTAWSQHMLYARLLVMATYANSPEKQYIIDRLYQNQVRMSELITKKYGEKAGHTVLFGMVGHMRNIISFLEAIKSGNQKAFDSTLETIYKDADQLGSYFNKLTNKNVFKKLVNTHTQAFINNILAYHYKNYQRDIKTLDEFFDTGIMMAVEIAHARS